ncbi:unnamed protein product [Pedinophyceae sp. YPF-701]|nr:unnamed protein product [Pedinophyceae sp. YPF-701]
MFGNFKFHQYQIVGRHVPTEKEPNPTIYRMKVWATDAVRARSKFWYYLSKLCRVKKSNGQVIACNEIFEKNPTEIKNYGIWVRYESRTGTHNMYKEFRNTTLNGAVEQLYMEMASRHRVRASALHIIRTAVVPARCKHAPHIKQILENDSFPVTRKVTRPSSKVHKTVFKTNRPNVALY